MKETIIQQGAEAIISLEDNQIKKHRIKKSYRIPEIDIKLRKSRTKSEAKIIEKLQNIIPVPKILKTDEKNFEIFLEYIDGKKLSDNLETLDYEEICKKIAENIAKIHDENIIHGDLTTSNMIYVKNPDKTLAITKKINQKNITNNQSWVGGGGVSLGGGESRASEASEVDDS